MVMPGALWILLLPVLLGLMFWERDRLGRGMHLATSEPIRAGGAD